MGDVLRNAIQCPACGASYSVIVPRSTSTPLEKIVDELRQNVARTCGQHPPIIQKPMRPAARFVYLSR